MPISDKQKAILAFPYTSYKCLIADGAIRSGKTMFMIMSFVRWAMENFNNQRFGICGKTVNSAKKNIIEPYLGVRYDKKRYKIKWNSSDKTMTITCGNRKNIFEVFGGKDDSSYTLIQGRTLAGVLLDEVALMPENFVLQAISRCSVEGSRLWFNCNPESPTHWFYNEWILQPEAHNALHLHFLLEDNPSLSEDKIAEYKSWYTGIFYQRYILGEWVIAEGLVYEFGEDNITDEQPQGAEYYISIDYGTLNPFSAGLWSVTGAKATRIKEYYYSGRETQHQKTDEEYCDAVEELAKGYKIARVIVDPSAASFITALSKRGFAVIKANNDVLDGIRIVSRMLKNGNIMIHRSCTNCIREFGLYSWDDRSSEDTVIKENDHCLTGDTLVMTENGEKPIKELVGTTGNVWSFNVFTGESELKPYKDCRVTQKQVPIWELRTSSGKTIKGTLDHMVLTEIGWLELGRCMFICVLTIDGKYERVTSIHAVGCEDVYNMEVEDNHNFAVNGGLIVHNCMDDLRYFVYTVLRYRKDNVKRLSWMP